MFDKEKALDQVSVASERYESMKEAVEYERQALNARIRDAKKAGATQEQIAAQTNLTRGRIGQILQEQP